jgi:hypothetical protein
VFHHIVTGQAAKQRAASPRPSENVYPAIQSKAPGSIAVKKSLAGKRGVVEGKYV